MINILIDGQGDRQAISTSKRLDRKNELKRNAGYGTLKRKYGTWLRNFPEVCGHDDWLRISNSLHGMHGGDCRLDIFGQRSKMFVIYMAFVANEGGNRFARRIFPAILELSPYFPQPKQPF